MKEYYLVKDDENEDVIYGIFETEREMLTALSNYIINVSAQESLRADEILSYVAVYRILGNELRAVVPIQINVVSQELVLEVQHE